MHIFFSVGEPSGDQHAAHLIHELRRQYPGVRTSGFGGPLMAAQGCKTLFDLTTLAVMGFLQVVPLIRKFYGLVQDAAAMMERDRPDLVVLVDFPGFNWWIAAKAKKLGIPVAYYMPPQLWAWAPWRIRKVRKYIDHVFSGLQFETEWYARRNIPVTYVGHPFFDEVNDHRLDESFCREWQQDGQRIIALLPGSRRQEVQSTWPLLLEAARRVHRLHPNAMFLVANYKEQQRDWCVAEYMRTGAGLPIGFFVGKTPEIIDLAECALMASGSVSLEMLARRTPAVVVYRSTWSTYLLGKMLVRCKYMALPNLMRDRVIFPEYMSVGDPEPAVQKIVADLDRWLAQPAALEKVVAEMDDLRREAGTTGATRLVAQQLLAHWGPVTKSTQHAKRAA